jgi:hypothetical protein
VLACGEEAPAIDTAAEHWCDGLCRVTRRCGDERTQADCRSECAAERPGLENLSVRGGTLMGACISNLSCQQVYDEAEWDAATDACWQDAGQTVAPTARTRSFCASYSETWFECGSWLSTQECEGIYGMWDDGVIDRVAACELSPTCGELDLCVETTFDTL